MSPQDSVERVLKEMHVMFQKSLDVGGMPDKMVVDRAEFMDLLDRLTTGIYELMEQYEQTRSSRMAAERNFRRSADEIIEQANSNAEDIYAASILYTADAIGKIRALMDKTNDSMNELFVQFRRELREQKDQLRANESELQAQLTDLSDTRKYLSILRDINREQERKNRDLEAEREMGNQYARNLFHAAVATPPAGQGAAGTASGSGGAAPGAGGVPPAGDQPEVTVNQNAQYFKWKEQQEGGAAGSGRAAAAGGQAGSAKKAAAGGQAGSGRAAAAGGQAGSGRAAAAGGQAGAAKNAAAGTQPGAGRNAQSAQNRNGQGGPVRVTPKQQEPEERYPNEDVIYQQVLEDERRREAEENDNGQMGAGEVIRTILFGRDEE